MCQWLTGKLCPAPLRLVVLQFEQPLFLIRQLEDILLQLFHCTLIASKHRFNLARHRFALISTDRGDHPQQIGIEPVNAK